METLFVYGTLLQPVLRERVFGRPLGGQADALEGYEKKEAMVAGSFPGLVRRPTGPATVQGLRFELPPELLARADAYEGALYRREVLRLVSGAKAWVYLPAENPAP